MGGGEHVCGGGFAKLNSKQSTILEGEAAGESQGRAPLSLPESPGPPHSSVLPAFPLSCCAAPSSGHAGESHAPCAQCSHLDPSPVSCVGPGLFRELFPPTPSWALAHGLDLALTAGAPGGWARDEG